MRKIVVTAGFVFLLALVFSSCKKPSTTYNVYFGSGAGCVKKGICYHPPAGSTIPATFTLRKPELLEIAFSMSDLKIHQPTKVPDFFGKANYTFDEPWVAPYIIDSALHLTRPLIIWPGNYKLDHVGHICKMYIPIGAGNYSTTVRFGHGSMCSGKDICTSGPNMENAIHANFSYDGARIMIMTFRMSELRANPDPGQQAQINYFMPGGLAGPESMVIYPFDLPWVAPPDMVAALRPPSNTIIIQPGIPNQVNTADGELFSITFMLNGPPIPPTPPTPGGG